MIRYGSLFSGIEAATVAWHSLGWQAEFFAEIEAFPSAVLAHHYPAVPNLGDVTKHKDWPHAAIDLLVGGSPCQAFSVAGLRKGLDDPRGNLTLTYLAVVEQYRPRWVVWENVPGVLSIDGGRVFGAFLGGLGQLGYGYAYRVLDAQYFGVAQRRRRVFVVGHLGDWRRAAAVLFERHSLSGHPAPRRETGEGIAAGTLRSTTGGRDIDHGRAWHLIPQGHCGETAPTLNAAFGSKLGLDNQHIDSGAGLFVAHSLRAEGFDASEDGTGRGTPLVPIPFDTTQITSAANYSSPRSGDPCHPLAAGAHAPAIAFDSRQDCISSAEAFGALGSSSPQAQAVALRGREGGGTAELSEVPSALRASSGGGDKAHVLNAMQVRRLTPLECERLQGFPDNYTLIPTKAAKKLEADMLRYLRIFHPEISDAEAKRLAKDGPRYKALGNSMAVPCMYYIGKRIQTVEALIASEPSAMTSQSVRPAVALSVQQGEQQ